MQPIKHKRQNRAKMNVNFYKEVELPKGLTSKLLQGDRPYSDREQRR